MAQLQIKASPFTPIFSEKWPHPMGNVFPPDLWIEVYGQKQTKPRRHILVRGVYAPLIILEHTKLLLKLTIIRKRTNNVQIRFDQSRVMKPILSKCTANVCKRYCILGACTPWNDNMFAYLTSWSFMKIFV